MFKIFRKLKGKRYSSALNTLGSLCKPFLFLQKRKLYFQKLIKSTHVIKVTAGAPRTIVQSVYVVGNGNGRVGLGVGRSQDKEIAIEQALLNGKRHCLSIPLTHTRTIPLATEASCSGTKIKLSPASAKAGIIAGGASKAVLELAGIKNVISYRVGADNVLNSAKATISALAKLISRLDTLVARSTNQKMYYSRMLLQSSFLPTFQTNGLS